jgi:hypothetical protein
MVKEEIEKCELLCANCHAVEEYGTGFKELSEEAQIRRMNAEFDAVWNDAFKAA